MITRSVRLPSSIETSWPLISTAFCVPAGSALPRSARRPMSRISTTSLSAIASATWRPACTSCSVREVPRSGLDRFLDFRAQALIQRHLVGRGGEGVDDHDLRARQHRAAGLHLALRRGAGGEDRQPHERRRFRQHLGAASRRSPCCQGAWAAGYGVADVHEPSPPLCVRLPGEPDRLVDGLSNASGAPGARSAQSPVPPNRQIRFSGEEVKIERFVVAFEPARQRPALDVDIVVAAVHVLVGRAHGDVVVEAVLDAGAEAELLIHGQSWRALDL